MSAQLPLLVDSHAHLDGGQFNNDRDETIARAHDNGISHILTIGCDMESSAASLALATKHEYIYAAVGVHPHDATEINDDTLKQLEELLGRPKVVALGEIGLDFFRDRSPRDVQREAFRKQIRLARKVGKPIIVHDRDAHDEVLQILEEENAAEVGGVLHCFSGDVAMAKKCLEMGFYLSFPGTITYPKNEAARDVVRAVPIDKILVETDCPYLSPQKFRGKRNEPAYVRYTAEKVAEIKGLTIEDVARVTSRNCFDLFGFGEVDQSTKIAYQIRNSLYLNITNRCTNHCIFCAKFSDYVVKGHELFLEREPTVGEVKQAIGDPSSYDEVVFCGYGEPLLRLDLIKEIAGWLKQQGVKVRINSDGQANLVHKRNILPELAGLVDAISVSLNAPNADEYQRLCQSGFGSDGYQAVKDFIRQAPEFIPDVTATAVTVPGVDIAACEQVAKELGVQFRVREYQEVG
ncbi:TatD DNase family protein [Malonomonas rubra DSM 5091]|uniref:TatD DNase family protein n=1 Tax=Malonomonas rubra DSM 5091 TaxID=1122189 RepID=A0A1M6DH00_MALRU|nr:TatD family hydrolase [Malonomonas rubra]SHI72450.1 TatD DNase family protein [Malonomonas rubra DSM 5091]